MWDTQLIVRLPFAASKGAWVGITACRAELRSAGHWQWTKAISKDLTKHETPVSKLHTTEWVDFGVPQVRYKFMIFAVLYHPLPSFTPNSSLQSIPDPLPSSGPLAGCWVKALKLDFG